jgi:hypothetical protein
VQEEQRAEAWIEQQVAAAKAVSTTQPLGPQDLAPEEPERRLREYGGGRHRTDRAGTAQCRRSALVDVSGTEPGT